MVCDLGKQCASSAVPQTLAPEQEEAAKWMQDRQLAYLNSKGQFLLHSSSLVFATNLSAPKLSQEPEDLLQRSLWSLRRQLVSRGWRKGESGKHGSVDNKTFHGKCEHHAYYAILLDRDVDFTKDIFFSVRCCSVQLVGFDPRTRNTTHTPTN